MTLFYMNLFVFLLILLGTTQAEDGYCDLSTEWLESVTVSIDITKRGFHRELVYSVQYGPLFLHGLRVLLVQRLPSGVYMDPHQLASLREDTGLQVLLDSEVDLEAPAYVSPGFSAFIYPSPDPRIPGRLQAAVPIHGRYHRPSDSGRGWERVEVEPPRLMLWSDFCKPLRPSAPDTVVDAPCTIHNFSVCSWLEIQTLQVPGSVSLEIPVGDRALVVPVCAGTLLVTLLCCALLAGTVWKHGVF